MHPGRAFAWDEASALQRFIADVAFAHICIAVDGSPLTAHAPLAIEAQGAVGFHLARANPLVPHLDGACAVATVLGENAYVSPDWYGTADQVPTWNYRLVEARGLVRRLDTAELTDQLDRLSAAQEARLAPKPAWTRDKLTPDRMASLLGAIVGFSIDRPALRGIAKLGQNKRADERAGAIAALHARGDATIATAMRDAAPALTRATSGAGPGSGSCSGAAA